jgi:hypothetical protein
MSFFTVGSGGSTVAIPVNTFTEDEVYRVGDQKRSISGTLRSDVSVEMRRFTLRSLMTVANLALLEALIIRDTEQPVAGDALRNGGAALTCQLRVTSKPYEHDQAISDGFQIDVTLHCEQVS